MNNSPIYSKWISLGGSNGYLGNPITHEYIANDNSWRFQDFQGGSIYWSPKTGAHVVRGLIKEKWDELRLPTYEHGVEIPAKLDLGYPKTDETDTPDRKGKYNDFQGGSIYWSPKTGAHEVHGLILQKWTQLGRERSVLGFPKTDETDVPNADPKGKYNDFQGGSIYWSPKTGAHEMHGAILYRWLQLNNPSPQPPWKQWNWLGYPLTDEIIEANGESYIEFERGWIYLETWARFK